jgi:arginase family enzyme
MVCGRGEPDLVAACDGPTVHEEDAALLGGQVLDQAESRLLAASPVAQFGAGMLAGTAGRGALAGWAAAVANRVDAIYIAVDFDCLDEAGGWAVTMPEPDGMSLETAAAAVRILAEAMPVAGFGATGITIANGDGPGTVDAVATLAGSALLSR